MLSALFIVVVTYLFAAESFTHFLFPAPGEVARHFRAGALPVALFDLLVTAFALVIIVGWILIYAASHGRRIRMPQWAESLQVHIYLLLMNRLYLDAISMRLRGPVTHAIDRLNRTRLFFIVAAFLAVAPGIYFIAQMANFPPAQFVQLIIGSAVAAAVSAPWTLYCRDNPFARISERTRQLLLPCSGPMLWRICPATFPASSSVP